MDGKNELKNLTIEEMDKRGEWVKICLDGYRNKQKLLTAAYYNDCVTLDIKPYGMSQIAWDTVREFNLEAAKAKQRIQDEKNDHWALMITYNPKIENQKYNHLKTILDNLLKLKTLAPYVKASSIEQRGEDEEDMGKGAHFHLLLETHTNRRTYWLQKIGQALAKYDLFDKEKSGELQGRFSPSVDIKWYRKYEQNELTIPKKIKYISGDKCEEKMKKVNVDKKWIEINKSVVDFS